MLSLRVDGEPATFLTERAMEWKRRIKDRLQATPGCFPTSAQGLRLDFVVSSWKRNHQTFDLDNLGKLVLDELQRPAVLFVEATVARGDLPGVQLIIAERATCTLDLPYWFSDLPCVSQRQDRNRPHRALNEAREIEGNDALCVHLDVHEDAPLTDFGFGENPAKKRFVKPTLDLLWPVIGIDPTWRRKNDPDRVQGKDYRIRHLVITRSSARRSGVSVGVERMNESAGAAPR